MFLLLLKSMEFSLESYMTPDMSQAIPLFSFGRAPIAGMAQAFKEGNGSPVYGCFSYRMGQ